jgi:hypothetical protein
VIVQQDFVGYRTAKPITPSDAADLADGIAEGLYVGVSGSVAINDPFGHAATFSAVPAGQVLPIKVRRLKATGTTATGIVGLWR